MEKLEIKGIDDMACGLHTASSNNMEKLKKIKEYTMRHVGLHAALSNNMEKLEMKGIDDAACGLHTASSNDMEKLKKNKRIDDTACGLHAASSISMEELKMKITRQHSVWVAHCVVVILPVSFPLLPTHLALLQSF